MSDLALGEGKICFIVSPIGDVLAPLGSEGKSNYEQSITMWSKVFEPACAQFGLRAVRADKIADPGEIPNQIFTYLRDAHVVIADVSGANPNVMYELGLRHSRAGITIQVGEYARLPFDVTSIRTLQFNRDEAGLIDVRNQLVESLRVALQSGATDLRATSVFTDGSPSVQDSAADARRSAEPDDTSDPEEPGIAEVLAEGEAAIVNVTSVLQAGTEQIRLIGELTADSTAQFDTGSGRNTGFAGRLLVIRKLAEDLDEPSAVLEDTANEFLQDVGRIDLLVRHVIARVTDGDEDVDSLRDFLDSVTSLVDSAEEAAVGIAGMREGSRTMRKMSSSLKNVSLTIDRALGRYLEAIRQMQAWKSMIEDLDVPK